MQMENLITFLVQLKHGQLHVFMKFGLKHCNISKKNENIQ